MSSGKPLLHAIGNAHIDPVWLWTWNEGLETIRATFRSALDLLDEYPGFVFTASSAAFYHLLEQVEPEMLEEIKQRVSEGRWEIAGGWWVEPDANIPCGESLVRQALYGQRYFERTFGVKAVVGFNPDTFGHCGSLPQILNGTGIYYYAFLRPGPHEMELPGPVFWWKSGGGATVLASRICNAYATWFDESEQMEEHILANHRARPRYLNDYTVFYGVGNHGGGPTRKNIESLLGRGDREPAVELSSLGQYFESVSQQIEKGEAGEIPEVTGELQHHAPGCYSAHSDVKRHNRRSEHLLMTAEKVAAMAFSLTGRPYPREKLTEAWQRVLFSQFHDILAGTSLPAAYVDARDQFGSAAAAASEVIHFSVQSIARQIDTRGEGDALVLFNPLTWPVKAPIEIEPAPSSVAGVDLQQIQATSVTGPRRAAFVADLPALGWQLYRQNVAEKAANSGLGRMLEVSETSLENDLFRIELEPETGEIAQLVDKRCGVQLFGSPGNAAIVLDDPSDTWSHGVSGFRDEIGRLGSARITVEESGPVRVAVRIETAWGKCEMTQRLYLYRDLDFIECRVTVNWQEQYKALKLSFPFAIEEQEAVYEIPYASVRREASGVEEPGQQWVDIGGYAHGSSGRLRYGAALLNDCKYGFDVLGAELRMTVLRSPAFAHHDPAKLDPNLAYPHLDQGLQDLTWRLVPHASDWQDAGIPERAFELNVPPITLNEYSHEGALGVSGSFVACDVPGVVVTVLKLAEDSDDLVVRAYDACGRGGQGKISLPITGTSWEADFAPGEIKSWRVGLGPGAEVTEVDLLEQEGTL